MIKVIVEAARGDHDYADFTDEEEDEYTQFSGHLMPAIADLLEELVPSNDWYIEEDQEYMDTSAIPHLDDDAREIRVSVRFQGEQLAITALIYAHGVARSPDDMLSTATVSISSRDVPTIIDLLRPAAEHAIEWLEDRVIGIYANDQGLL